MALQVVAVLVVLALAALFILAPLRSRGRAEALESAEIGELEAAREAKYREIREAELDFRTGKLDEADYRAVDRALRDEAIEILRRLDRAEGRGPVAD